MIGRNTLQSVCSELDVQADWVRAPGIGKTRLVTQARAEIAIRLDRAGWTRGKIARFLRCKEQTVDYYIVKRPAA